MGGVKEVQTVKANTPMRQVKGASRTALSVPAWVTKCRSFPRPGTEREGQGWGRAGKRRRDTEGKEETDSDPF